MDEDEDEVDMTFDNNHLIYDGEREGGSDCDNNVDVDMIGLAETYSLLFHLGVYFYWRAKRHPQWPKRRRDRN